MEDISLNAYLPLCEQYNSLAQSFYQQHLDIKNQLSQLGKPVDFFDNPALANTQNELAAGLLQTAICAVVFEAFAIESYVNFFGAYRLGDSTYYSIYESGEPGKRYSTIEKMKKLCKEQFNSPYPTDGKHFTVLKGLFTKRDNLAHNKPNGHEISTKNGDSFDDYSEAMSEIAFIYEGLEQEMTMYNEVKANLSASSKKPEPIAEFLESAATTIAKNMAHMMQRNQQPEE